jgi:uncharacterized protein YndB with AHSA1/START domain
MSQSTPSRIERSVWLRAPRARVWRALTDIEEFSRWFGVKTLGRFAPGAELHMTSTHPGTDCIEFSLVVERMEPERLFSWRWHPGSQQPKPGDPPAPKTLVEFRLEDEDGGTRLRLVESGFDEIALLRRAHVFQENTEGWDFQLDSLEKHVAGAA